MLVRRPQLQAHMRLQKLTNGCAPMRSFLGLRPKDINLIAENVFCTEMFVSALFHEKLETPQNI